MAESPASPRVWVPRVSPETGFQSDRELVSLWVEEKPRTQSPAASPLRAPPYLSFSAFVLLSLLSYVDTSKEDSEGLAMSETSESHLLMAKGTRVTYLVLPEYSGPLLHSPISVVGIDGKCTCPLSTQPLPCYLDSQTFTHAFLVLPSCPMPLLGQDILTKIGGSLLIPGPKIALPHSHKRGHTLCPYHLFAPTIADPSKPLVPNPYSILSQIPPDTTYYMVLDLKDAFFTILLSPNLQDLFVFTWTNPIARITRQLTWTVLPQEKVYKVYKDKGQFSKLQVIYLGLSLSPTEKGITSQQRNLILNIPLPQTKQELLTFLGLANFFHTWVPNFRPMAKHLYKATSGNLHEPIDNPNAIKYFFNKLKTALTHPSLSPSQKPFIHHTDTRDGFPLGVFTQIYSSDQRLASCLRALASTALLIQEILKLVPYDNLRLSPITNISPSQLQTLHVQLLLNPQVQITHSPNTPNPTRCFRTKTSPSTLHNCLDIIEHFLHPFPNIRDTPLPPPAIDLFIDGSEFKDPSKQADYAIVSHSLYAFHIIHSHSKNSPIINKTLIIKLFQAAQLPTQVVVIHCRGH
ncbi:LOW QUALITY PROTEIN: hypothetical protein QTO34_014208 [Cnephaeus nilssonii]|uniref:Peptidase A2 domain-containing protein n=1 Tax=Cnephaeus nilssonii TaxID=3371016 RepID=A0AA40I6X4_CNENI|nr:LOW QUALITY PROTEIN: hypothetical protein QTO34_014208 [Eptesicus nilssonii]